MVKNRNLLEYLRLADGLLENMDNVKILQD